MRSKTKSLDLVKEDVEKIRQEVKDLRKKMEASDEAQRAQLKANYDEFRQKYFRYFDPDDEDLDDPTDKPPTPEEDGRWQLHKGGNKDPKTWKVVPMTRNPGLFKIVDDKGINIADLYHTQANAQRDIDEAIKAADGKPLPDPKPDPDPTVPPKPPIPTPEPVAGDTPYPPKSPKMASTQRGPTERHYASGKPSDFTIEKNVKEIEFDNYQAVFEINNNVEWAHDDTFSIKGGGTHMGTGWKDSGVKVYSGEVCLGYEPDHPTTHLCEKKGPKIGDLRGKRFKIAWTYRNGDNHEEFWTDMGDGWKKQLEGDNVANFDAKSDVDEVQLRIDGFKSKDKPPDIVQAFVTAI